MNSAGLKITVMRAGVIKPSGNNEQRSTAKTHNKSQSNKKTNHVNAESDCCKTDNIRFGKWLDLWLQNCKILSLLFGGCHYKAPMVIWMISGMFLYVVYWLFLSAFPHCLATIVQCIIVLWCIVQFWQILVRTIFWNHGNFVAHPSLETH